MMSQVLCRSVLRAACGRSAPACAAWRPSSSSSLRHAVPRRAMSSTEVARKEYPDPRPNVPWHEFGFTLTTRETRMVLATCEFGRRWQACRSEPYGPLPLEPSTTALNYGQSIFEGLKAYRTEQGRIVLFRPTKNAQRMAEGARRMMMPPVPTQLFLEAASIAVKENADWVPPVGKGALYLRPLLFGSGADLGVKPSSEYTFVIYVAPVGKYFGPGSGGARMKLETEHQRAAPAGIGHVKAAANYAQCFSSQREAKYDGFSDVIYLDVNAEYIEEAAASNFFCVDENKVIHTPALGTILPGVTRDSVIQIVRRMRGKDIQLKVGKVSVETVMKSKEAFVTGTGAGITPIEHIGSLENSVNFDCPGPVTQMITEALTDIQLERVEDHFNWLHDPLYMESVGYDSFMDPTF